MVVMKIRPQPDQCNCYFSASFLISKQETIQALGEYLVTVFSHDGICTVINNGTET